MGLGVVSWRGERAGQVCYLRRGATGPADVRTGRLCGRPHASRGAALLELGGPLRGRGEESICHLYPRTYRCMHT